MVVNGSFDRLSGKSLGHSRRADTGDYDLGGQLGRRIAAFRALGDKDRLSKTPKSCAAERVQ